MHPRHRDPKTGRFVKRATPDYGPALRSLALCIAAAAVATQLDNCTGRAPSWVAVAVGLDRVAAEPSMAAAATTPMSSPQLQRGWSSRRPMVRRGDIHTLMIAIVVILGAFACRTM